MAVEWTPLEVGVMINGSQTSVQVIIMEKNPLKRVLRKFLCPEDRLGSGGGPAGDLRVAAVKDIPEGRPFCATVGGKEVAVFRSGGKFLALANTCAHMGGPLCQGLVADGKVACPWHGAQFSLETGAVLKGPATKGVASYELEVRGEDLYLKRPADPARQK